VLVGYTQPAGPRVSQAAGQRRGGPTQGRPLQVVLEAPRPPAFTSRWCRGGPTQGRSFQVVLEAPRLPALLVSLHKPLFGVDRHRPLAGQTPLLKEDVIFLSAAVILPSVSIQRPGLSGSHPPLSGCHPPLRGCHPLLTILLSAAVIAKRLSSSPQHPTSSPQRLPPSLSARHPPLRLSSSP
jgi:hypothetical protein